MRAFGIDIPLRSESDIAADVARSPFKDDEKVSETPFSSMKFRGVPIASRYSKFREYKTMMAMVAGVEPDHRHLIASIFCDSKATACYSVDLFQCEEPLAVAIIASMEAACFISDGGHNGIYVSGVDADFDLSVNPNWEEDAPEVEFHGYEEARVSDRV
jgi:hypothetical protein